MAETTLARRKLEADAAIAAHGVRCALLTGLTVPVGLHTTIADLAADLSPAAPVDVTVTTEIVDAEEELVYRATDAQWAGFAGDDVVGAVYYYVGGGAPVLSRIAAPAPLTTADGVIVRAGEGGIMVSTIVATP